MSGQSKYKKSATVGWTNKVAYKWMNDQSLLRVDGLNKSHLRVNRQPKSTVVWSKKKSPMGGRTTKVTYGWMI